MFQSVRDKIDHESLVTGLANDIEFTEEDKTAADVFRKVLHHCSYFNYDLLETIISVKMFGLDKHPLIDKYLEAFSKYCHNYYNIMPLNSQSHSTYSLL